MHMTEKTKLPRGARMNPERKRLIGAKGTERVDYILVKTYCQNKKNK